MAEEINIKKKKAEALRFLGKGKIDKAIEVYEEILKAKEDPDIYNAVGDLYVRKQNISKAIESYEKAYKLYKDIEFLDNAIAVIRKILKYEKDRKDLYLELAELYTELGNQDSALDALENVITDDLDPSMLERAFTIITQLAEKVQEDEASEKRFERLFLKLQEISEKFGEISLESGLGIEMEDDLFSSPAETPSGSDVQETQEEEGIVLTEESEARKNKEEEIVKETTPQEIGAFTNPIADEEEEFIFEDSGQVTTRKEERVITTEKKEEIPIAPGVSSGYDEIYASSVEQEEELIFEEEGEAEVAIEEKEENITHEIEEREPVMMEEAIAEEREKKPEDKLSSDATTDALVEEAIGLVEEEIKAESRVAKESSTEEVISRRPLEKETLPTTHKVDKENKYAEEFKGVVLTFIEEMGEANIYELYDFAHPFDTAMILYKMNLYEAAIDEFQRAMRDSEFRLKSMEMIGRIFYELGNYEMAVKMLEKALDEGGYEEHEYAGIRYFLALSYEAMGLEDKALENYEQLYLIDRTYKDVSERIDALKLKRMKSF